MNVAEILWAILAITGFSASIVFILSYDNMTGGSWAKNRMGRHLMGLIASIASCLGLITWTIFYGQVPRWIWVIVMAGVTYQIIERSLLLFTNRWRDDDLDDDDLSDNTIKIRKEFRG